MSEFAIMLEEARRAKGLSRLKAAAVLQTSPHTYRSWLRGQRPGYDWLPILIDFIDRDEAEIFRAVLAHGDAVPPMDRAKGVYLNSFSRLRLAA